MTLKEELEILRGEPIQVFDGDPMDIPCIETSDPERLCKNPVVSVHMITYNHEPYIRQAIEGAMMQKTDFEFELVIGEDCSQDKTREICFEYQKKYPDKIRVLWWHENVSKLGGNGRRTRARCRGEFIAICEGDDYWIDPLKLQKQVDIMMKHPNVGICFCGSKIYHGASGECDVWNKDNDSFIPGVISSKKYMLGSMFGLNPIRGFGCDWFQMTATFLARTEKLREAMQKYELFKWRIRVGDGIFSMGIGSISDAYYLKDIVSVYRRMPTGASTRDGDAGFVDTLVIRLYYLAKVFGLECYDAPDRVRRLFVNAVCSRRLRSSGRLHALSYVCALLRHRFSYKFIRRSLLYALSNSVSLPFVSRIVNGIIRRYEKYIHSLGMPRRLRDAYIEVC